MRTAIYIRTSTEEQNPENQLKDCLSIHKFGNYHVFEDKQSAWKDKNREGFDRVYNLMNKGKLDHIICWDLDRLYRNRKRLISFFKVAKYCKCKVHSFRQQWLDKLNDMPEPFDEIMHDLMLQIMGWLAEEESNKKSDRVKMAVRRRDKGTFSYKGNKWGRKVLSAYKRNKIVELRRGGMSIRGIAVELGVSKSVVHKYLTVVCVGD